MKSFHSGLEKLCRNLCPLPSLKYVEIVFSPECPKGGLPRSWHRQAAATISRRKLSFPFHTSFLYLCDKDRAISFAMERPTDETSKL